MSCSAHRKKLYGSDSPIAAQQPASLRACASCAKIAHQTSSEDKVGQHNRHVQATDEKNTSQHAHYAGDEEHHL